MTTPDEAGPRAQARSADEETRYQAVAGLDPADPGDRAVLLEGLADPSWRVRAAVADRIARTPDLEAVIPALVEEMVGGPNVGAREAAASALARIGGPAVPALVGRLEASDPELRLAAVSVLGVIGDRRAVPPLAARLADGDPNVRASAAEALGRVGGGEAAAALRAALDSDDPTLRLTALDALAGLRVWVSRSTMERLLADRGTRRAAYRLMGVCDEPEVLELIARGLREATRSVREAALGALGGQRTRRSIGELEPLLREAREAAEREPALVDAWATALAAKDLLVAVGALTAVGATGGGRHAAAMLRLAEDDRFRSIVEEAIEALPPDPALRGALAEALPGLGQLSRLTALGALARLGSPAAFESIVREASDPESYVQAEAVAALGRLRDDRGVVPLAGLLGDDAPAVASLASGALVRVARSGEAGLAAVLQALRDRAGASSSAAVYRTLGAVGEVADLEVLGRGLRAEPSAHRSAAAAAIGALGRRRLLGAREVAQLAVALSDPSWQVRAAAARAIGDVARGTSSIAVGTTAEGGGPLRAETALALQGALRDPEPAVRAAAVDALGAGGRAEDAPAVATLAGDPSSPPAVVVAALRALGVLGATTIEVVRRAASHPDPEVVKEAVLSAARIPGDQGARILREAAGSPRWDVRQAAARAMAERGDRALGAEAARLAACDPDPLVARAFADAARSLGAG